MGSLCLFAIVAPKANLSRTRGRRIGAHGLQAATEMGFEIAASVLRWNSATLRVVAFLLDSRLEA